MQTVPPEKIIKIIKLINNFISIYFILKYSTAYSCMADKFILIITLHTK